MSLRDSLFRMPQAGADMIDVNALIAQLSDSALLESADAYFAGLTLTSEQCRKPFSNPRDAAQITRNLGLLFEAGQLFPNCDVLDFGCATGWLTLALASAGCRATGVDISRNALALAEQLRAKSEWPAFSSADFLAYDGKRLPLDDSSVDRILCFDAFHHVKDQAATLAEFSRVLRPGGRIAMLEPGPHHSRTPQSQEEMRRYRVIENDVVMADIARNARAAGLDAPEMLVQFHRPVSVQLREYQQWATSGVPAARAGSLASRLASELEATQCFSMTKGKAVGDSREERHLRADIRLVGRPGREADDVRVSVVVRNTGSGTWLTGDGAAPGTVKLGIQALEGGGAPLMRDFMRISLPSPAIQPESEVQLSFVLPLARVAGSLLRLDMVSEHVAWFSQTGRCTPLELQVDVP
jgi:ubiquinone/menaquinone biosynthesis C-methylase UbiE